MKNISFIAIIILATITNAVAQEKEEYSKWEIYGGYSRMKSANEENSGKKDERHGYEVAVTRNFNRYLGVKFDHHGNFLSDPGIMIVTVKSKGKYSNYNFSGGIQVKDNSSKGRIKPFAHALFGVLRTNVDVELSPCVNAPTCSNSVKQTGFTMTFGGGIDVKVNKRITIRPIQIDYFRVDKDAYIHKPSNIRLGAGIVFTKGDAEIPVATRAKNYTKYEIHAGYSYNKRSLDGMPITVGNIYTKGLQGYNSSIKWNFQRFLGAEFEHSAGWSGAEGGTILGVAVASNRSLYTFAGGIQIKDNASKTRLKPFGHALFGGAIDSLKAFSKDSNSSVTQINNRTDFVMIFGGGLDVKVNNRFSVRVFQFDYLRSRQAGTNSALYIKYYRFGAGIVFH